MRLSALLCVALLGCGTEPGPESFDATYVLRSINGQPLPASTVPGVPVALADTMWFSTRPTGQGYFLLRRAYALRLLDGTIQVTRDSQEYRRDRSSVVILPPCAHDPLALCTGPTTATLDGPRLTIDYPTEPPATLSYERVK